MCMDGGCYITYSILHFNSLEVVTKVQFIYCIEWHFAEKGKWEEKKRREQFKKKQRQKGMCNSLCDHNLKYMLISKMNAVLF